MLFWWSRHVRRADRTHRFAWAGGSAWASAVLVCAVAMVGAVAWAPLGAQPADESDGASNGTGPPAAVISCLALGSDQERASCFAAFGAQNARGAPPEVKACLSAPTDAQRASCFAAGSPGSRSPAMPPRVAECLAKTAGTQRGSCFAALRGQDKVVGARVARCLSRPAGRQRASCFRRAVR
jgi:hypothetical protein